MELRQWPIPLETQARPPEIAILSHHGADHSMLSVGNLGVAISVTQDAYGPTLLAAHINERLWHPLSMV